MARISCPDSDHRMACIAFVACSSVGRLVDAHIIGEVDRAQCRVGEFHLDLQSGSIGRRTARDWPVEVGELSQTELLPERRGDRLPIKAQSALLTHNLVPQRTSSVPVPVTPEPPLTFVQTPDELASIFCPIAGLMDRRQTAARMMKMAAKDVHKYLLFLSRGGFKPVCFESPLSLILSLISFSSPISKIF